MGARAAQCKRAFGGLCGDVSDWLAVDSCSTASSVIFVDDGMAQIRARG